MLYMYLYESETEYIILVFYLYTPYCTWVATEQKANVNKCCLSWNMKCLGSFQLFSDGFKTGTIPKHVLVLVQSPGPPPPPPPCSAARGACYHAYQWGSRRLVTPGQTDGRTDSTVSTVQRRAPLSSHGAPPGTQGAPDRRVQERYVLSFFVQYFINQYVYILYN